jgi:hypothetical protein
MEKEWEMIFDVTWSRRQQQKWYHQSSDTNCSADNMTTEEKRQHMGVTPRGTDDGERGAWEPTLAIAVPRPLPTWEKEQKEETDEKEDEAQIKEHS